MTRRLRPVLSLLALSLGGAGCSFEAPDSNAAFSSNTCSYDEECGPDEECVASMCVVRSIDDSLRVILDVTPLQQPDGPPPVSVTLESINVRSSSGMRQWTLPEPVLVRGTIRNGASVVDADVTLTLKQPMAGLPPKIVMTSVAGTVAQDSQGHDFEVLVGSEGEYTLRVQPKDTNFPPYTEDRQIIRGEPIVVDYAKYDVQRTIRFTGEVEERPLIVRAFDIATGALISSTAAVVRNEATLRFAAEPEQFRLVIRPEGAYDPEGLSGAETCDHDTPVLPTFSINLSEADLDADSEVFEVEIPSAPPRIQFLGQVKLCDVASVDGTMEPARLPITLRSTAVTIDEPTGRWSAEIATDTEALRDSASGEYKYCVDVFQGEYEVVVTPPESKPCEIFAQRLPIESSDGVKVTPPPLELEPAAQLFGELSAGMMPLTATTIDVQSLGRAIELEPDAAALTAFSRSRQTTTDATGAFRLPVDRGSYDVTIKPPAGSGYAWYVRRDVTIGSNGEFENDIEMTSPVAVNCEIRSADGEMLTGTEITAYTVVTDDEGVQRAVAIGKAAADESGRFMLLLPTAVYEGWSSAGIVP
jgi:hypothetical protein